MLDEELAICKRATPNDALCCLKCDFCHESADTMATHAAAHFDENVTGRLKSHTVAFSNLAPGLTQSPINNDKATSTDSVPAITTTHRSPWHPYRKESSPLTTSLLNSKADEYVFLVMFQ
jgi:hypothetical protein